MYASVPALVFVVPGVMPPCQSVVTLDALVIEIELEYPALEPTFTITTMVTALPLAPRSVLIFAFVNVGVQVVVTAVDGL